MTIDELKRHKKILIVGYGIEGKATERFLRKHCPEVEIGITDMIDGDDYLDIQSNYELAVRTPLLRPHELYIPYTTATNIFFANVPDQSRTIGVTGTKGKSTTVSMLHHILTKLGKKSVLLGNIGNPMLDVLTDGLSKDTDIILELSSYQLEDIEYSPHLACLLNIHKELHNHETYDEYIQAKSHITQYQSHEDYFFYNGENIQAVDIAQATHARKQDISKIDVSGIDLGNYVHKTNLQAVVAITSHLGFAYEDVTRHLKTFKPLPHRVQEVKTIKGVTYINDSASTHPNATIHALEKIPQVSAVILGGQDRGYDYTELVHTLAIKKVKYVFLLPETEDTIMLLIRSTPNYTPEIHKVKSIAEAVTTVTNSISNGVCLLSPGAPSYLQYANFGKRGEDFTRIVKSLTD